MGKSKKKRRREQRQQNEKQEQLKVLGSLSDSSLTLSRGQYLLAFLLVIFVTIIAYLPTLSNGFVPIDDDQYVTENLLIRDFTFTGVAKLFTSFYASNYHPLTGLSNMLEYSLCGLNPRPYHLVNLLLHVLNSILVFILVSFFVNRIESALIVTLLFAVHPLHVESVAWISERKDILYTFFFLLSLIFYQRYLTFAKNVYNFGLALIFFILSLLSKSAAITLPLFLLLFDYYANRSINKRSILEKIPFFILSIVFGIIAIVSQKGGGAISDLSTTFSLLDRFFLINYSIMFYVVKSIFPINLAVFHFYPVKVEGFLPFQYYLAPVGLGMLLFSAYLARNLRKILSLGIFFFLIPLIVILQFIPLGQTIVAERYTYVPYIGLFLLVIMMYENLAGSNAKKNSARIVFPLVSGIVILIFAVMAHQQCKIWSDGEKLLTQVIENYPKHYYGYFVRGSNRDANHDFEGALEDYNIGIALHPTFAHLYNNRGNTLKELKQYKRALIDLNQAIELNSSRGEYFNNRGLVKSRLGDQEAAILDFNEAIELKPDFYKAYNNRGVSKGYLKNMKAAIEDFNKAINFNSNYAEAFNNRGNAKASLQDYRGSIDDYNRVLEMDAYNGLVLYNRGLSKYFLSLTEEACRDWEKAEQAGYKVASDALVKYCQ